MKICSFLWVYYGYPTSTYEGVNVEQMRYTCGDMLAQRDNVNPDIVAGVPDSGIAHAIGYANRSERSICTPLYQIYTYLASFLHACASEPERTDCSYEIDSCSGAD